MLWLSKFAQEILCKKTKKGFRGYPVATVAYYGPDNKRASKVEEGIDYPEGGICPKCPYWAYRDRWTGEIIH